MRYLITGGAGFIGTNLLPRLTELPDSHHVIVLDHIGYTSNPEHLHSSRPECAVELVRDDIRNEVVVRDLVKDVDVIIHLAAESYVDLSIDRPTLFHDVNVSGTLVLLEAVRGQKIKRILHVSTDEVWGDSDTRGTFKETSTYDPRNPYSASKAAADHFVRSWGHTYGLPFVIVHFTNLFGPYQYPQKLIPRFIVRMFTGQPLPLYGDGSHKRTWLYVDDAVRGLLCVLQHAAADTSYIVGAEKAYTNLEIARMIIKQFGADEQIIEFVPDRPGHDKSYLVDCSRIHQDLGWYALKEIQQGINETVSWFAANREWWLSRLEHANKRDGLLNTSNSSI